MNFTQNLFNQKRLLLPVGLFFIFLIVSYYQLNKKGYIPPLNYLPEILSLNHKQTAESYHTNFPQGKQINPNKPLKELLNLQTTDKNQISILVEKSQYRLTIYYKKQPIKTYPVVFGENPIEDKQKEGDQRTPEGIFKIKNYYPHPEWSKFLWLDYPTKDSWKKHIQAKLQGKIKWYDKVGSEIGIHGHPADREDLIKTKINWTFGCVSLKNQHLEEIYPLIQKNTLIEITK